MTRNIKSKIVGLMAIILMIILTIPNMSNAAGWWEYQPGKDNSSLEAAMANGNVKEGDIINLTYNTVHKNGSGMPQMQLLCVEYLADCVNGQHKVTDAIKIVGKYAYNADGKKSGPADINAKVAYLLSLPKATTKEEKRARQIVMWGYINSFANTNKSILSGDVRFKGTSNGGSSDRKYLARANEIRAAADKYANSLSDNEENSLEVTDSTPNKDNLPSIQQEKQTIIGPLIWDYTGEIKVSDLIVNDMHVANGEGVEIGTWKNEQFTALSKDAVIPSNKEMYLAIDNTIMPNAGEFSIHISGGKIQTSSKTVRVYLLDPPGSSSRNQQTLIGYGSQEDSKEKELEFDYKVNLGAKRGSIVIKKIDENGNYLNGAKFKVSTPDGVTLREDIVVENGEVRVDDLPIAIELYVQETEAPKGYVKDDTIYRVWASPSVEGSSVNIVTVTNIKSKEPRYGKFEMLKIGAINNTSVPLSGFTFVLNAKSKEDLDDWDNRHFEHHTAGENATEEEKAQVEDYNLWADKQNSIIEEYNNSLWEKAQNIELVTDNEGKASASEIPVGNYILTETSTGDNTYFEPGKTWEIRIEEDGTTTVTAQTLENEPKYLDLSGYVWVDDTDGKQSVRNDLYDQGEKRFADMLVELITDKGTMSTRTNENGEYEFLHVPIDWINDNSMVQFTYNGLKYQSVIAKIDVENGSKASENQEDRENKNKEHSTEEAGKRTQDFEINANTKETQFDLYDHIVMTDKQRAEIRNINLGVYLREQPDSAIMKDVYNTKIMINGKTYTYNYADRFKEENLEEMKGVDWKAAFKNELTDEYFQPIYPSDISYNNDTDESKELQVYVTYKIAMKNEATSSLLKINKIAEYFDSRYEFVKAEIQTEGENDLKELPTTDINLDGGDYKGVILNLSEYSELIQPKSMSKQSIYVTVKVQNKDDLWDIMFSEGEDGLDNIIEIYSQTYYAYCDKHQRLEPYAGYDEDSTPGNCNPNNSETWEDDTDLAPQLKIIDAGKRTATGTVFEDIPEGIDVGAVNTNKERNGDGQYTQNKDNAITGMKVSLVEVNDDGTEKADGQRKDGITIDSEGNYIIEDFIPGNYVIKFEWGKQVGTKSLDGAKVYNTYDYKSTIYVEEGEHRQSNAKWYVENEPMPRYSDALDEYSIRQEIDGTETTKGELEINDKNLTAESWNTYEDHDITMFSSTPIMDINVERTKEDWINRVTKKEKETYDVTNVDFGIVERPKQKLELIKYAKNVTIILPNGTEYTNVDMDIDIDGNGNITYVYDEVKNFNIEQGGGTLNPRISVTMDKELISGSTIRVTYGIKVRNLSELDWNNQEYYWYGPGHGQTDETLQKIKPTEIVDYLDSEWSFDLADGRWTKTDIEQLRTDGLVSQEVVDNMDQSKRVVLTTTQLSNTALKPGEDTEATITISKQMSSEDELLYKNDAEFIKVSTNGRMVVKEERFGNFIPDYNSPNNGEPDGDTALDIEITVPHGGDGITSIIIATTVVIGLIILGVGVIIIKKKVLNTK